MQYLIIITGLSLQALHVQLESCIKGRLNLQKWESKIFQIICCKGNWNQHLFEVFHLYFNQNDNKATSLHHI